MAAHIEMAKAVRSLAHRHSTHQVFSDFVEMAALSFSNAVDWSQREKREQRYMDIVKGYKKDEIDKFPKLLGMLTMGLEEAPNDILGKLFHELELHNTYKGQFFTPYNLCRLMAKMTLEDDVKDKIAERGFVTASEPACGSGATIIALADEMKRDGINYQQCLHVTGVDLDIRCVHMAYLQFSLLHIPAIVVHGNTLSLEEFGHWYTPAHIMDGWNYRLKQSRIDSAMTQGMQEAVKEVTKPPVAAVEAKPVNLVSGKAMQLKLF